MERVSMVLGGGGKVRGECSASRGTSLYSGELLLKVGSIPKPTHCSQGLLTSAISFPADPQ